MLQDGLYSLDYTVSETDRDLSGSGLIMLRDGCILGTDRRGGVFVGAYVPAGVDAGSRVTLQMQVPPQGELVTGYAAGAEGASVDILGATEQATAGTTVEVAGQPVEVRLTWIGALPN